MYCFASPIDDGWITIHDEEEDARDLDGEGRGAYGVERAVRLEALLEDGGLVLGEAELLPPAGAVRPVLVVAADAARAGALELPLVVVVPAAGAAGERGGAVGRRGRAHRRAVGIYGRRRRGGGVVVVALLLLVLLGGDDGAERGGPRGERAAGRAGGGGGGEAALGCEPEAEAEVEAAGGALGNHIV